VKVILLFPPHWEPMMPHLALPSLTAYLRRHGVEVIQRDLNIEVFDEVLSRRYLNAVLRQLRRNRRARDSGNLDTRLARARAQVTEWALGEGWKIAAEVDRAKEIIRSGRFFEPELSLKALLTLMQALQLASAPHFPSALSFTQYDSAYPPDSTHAILAGVQDRKLNLFHDLFRRTIVPDIVREKPDIVGISLTSAHQVIAGFTLAYLIKETGINTHITLGGKMITCWHELLPHRRELWELFDSAIPFQGEVPLLRLVEALERGGDLASVPNLIYRDGSRIQVNPPQPPKLADGLPIPDFGGLPLDRYLAPVRVLPIAASRGCYWARCAFCNVGYGESLHFSEKRAQRVAEEMMTLAKRYNTRYFFFADEALSPRMLKLLSAQLIVSGVGLNWTCCARFEPGISGELLRRMRQAGCRMVLYGLESGSQRVLDRMGKGIRLEVAQRILREGAEAGIWNHVFIFFGFPGETEEEAQATVDFFYTHGDAIHSLCSGTFLLEKHSRVAQDPGAYGVTRLISRPGADLAYYYDYEVSSGISAARAEEIEAQFVNGLPDKQYPQFYFHDIYRFLYASHLQDSELFPTMLGELTLT